MIKIVVEGTPAGIENLLEISTEELEYLIQTYIGKDLTLYSVELSDKYIEDHRYRNGEPLCQDEGTSMFVVTPCSPENNQ